MRGSKHARRGVRERAQLDLAADTDGEIWNNDVRIVDPESGAELPSGDEGEITARGPELFLGYAREEDNRDAFDGDGFFRTGDLGRIDHGAFITVTGRKKDLIIRGGENIAPKEIEDVLHRQPRIREVAVAALLMGARSYPLMSCEKGLKLRPLTRSEMDVYVDVFVSGLRNAKRGAGEGATGRCGDPSEL